MNTNREIEIAEYNLQELHRKSVVLSVKIMRMAGAEDSPVEGISDASVVFWVFTDNGEHATIDAAIQRISGHPATQKLITDYHDVTAQMIEVERRIARMAQR